MKYIVIGLGNYGGGLAEELMAIGHEVIGVDQNEGRVDNLKDKITTAFVLDATDELVRKITGKYPIYARAPYGEVPENGDVDRQRFYIGWTVDPLDWMTEDVSRITQSVLEKVEPGDIILLHDSYLSSVQAALRIVDALQGKGYEFITVDQMISD